MMAGRHAPPRWDRPLSKHELRRLSPLEKRLRSETSLVRKIEALESWAETGGQPCAGHAFPRHRSELASWEDEERRLWSWSDKQITKIGGRNADLMQRFDAVLAARARADSRGDVALEGTVGRQRATIGRLASQVEALERLSPLTNSSAILGGGLEEQKPKLRGSGIWQGKRPARAGDLLSLEGARGEVQGPAWDRPLGPADWIRLPPSQKNLRTTTSLRRKVEILEGWLGTGDPGALPKLFPGDRAKLAAWSDDTRGVFSWSDKRVTRTDGPNAGLMRRYKAVIAAHSRLKQNRGNRVLEASGRLLSEEIRRLQARVLEILGSAARHTFQSPSPSASDSAYRTAAATTPPPPRTRKTTKPNDFAIGELDHVAWRGLPRSGMVTLSWPDGSLCEPAVAYLAYLRITRGRKPDALRNLAYVLREWLAFLASRVVPWWRANDSLLDAWRSALRTNAGDGDKGADSRPDAPLLPKAKLARARATIASKVSAVFRFYEEIDQAMPVMPDGARTPAFVARHDGDGGAVPKHPFTTRTARQGRHLIRRWALADRTRHRSPRRATPDAEDVIRLQETIRSGKKRTSCARPGVDEDCAIAMLERDYLASELISRLGLRQSEAANVTVEDLLQCLSDEGIVFPPCTKGVNPLDACACDFDERGRIVGALEALEGRRRRTVFLTVIGKGDKVRKIPVPVALMKNILDIGVWGCRALFLARAAKGRTPAAVSSHLFLSLKTARGLQAGSLGDIMKRSFHAIERPAYSGHRLRAFALTQRAIELVREHCLGTDGRPLHELASVALMRLAEEAGHSNPETTFKFYIDLAYLYWQQNASDGRGRELHRQVNSLIALLGDTDLKLFGKFVEELLQGGADKDVFRHIGQWSNLRASLRDQRSEARKHLTLVHSTTGPA